METQKLYLSLDRYWSAQLRPWRNALAQRAAIGISVPLLVSTLDDTDTRNDTITMPTIKTTQHVPHAEVSR